MINLQDMKQHALTVPVDKWGQRMACIDADKLLILIEGVELLEQQTLGLAEVVRNAEELRTEALELQSQMTQLLPDLEAQQRQANTALAYLRTLAGFGGTVEQARALAGKALEELK